MHFGGEEVVRGVPTCSLKMAADVLKLCKPRIRNLRAAAGAITGMSLARMLMPFTAGSCMSIALVSYYYVEP